MRNSWDESERVSRAHKKKKRSKIKAVAVLAIFIVVIYLAAAVVVSVRSNLSTTVAQNGAVVESIEAPGYVFRNQTIINAPASGHLECIVNDGDRVREGQTIGYMCENMPDPVVMEQIKEIHKAIRRNGLNDNSVYTTDAGSSEHSISEIARELSDLRQNRDLRDAEEKKDEINHIIGRRDTGGAPEETSEADGTDGEEKAEEAEIDRLRAKLSTALSGIVPYIEIKATAGGVFSARVDGMEDMLSYDKAVETDAAYLDELDKLTGASPQETEAGQPICKIVNNYSWRFVCEVGEEDAKNIQEGQKVRLDLFDLTDNSIEGNVTRISAAEGGKNVLVISTNKYVDGIYSSSRVNANIVTVNAEGIRLPVECLRVKDEITGVYVVRLDKATFVPVNVRYKNDEWAVVSAAVPTNGGAKLQIYDEVIVECRELEDGKIVR